MSKKKKKLKTLKIVLLVLLIILGIIAGVAYWYIHDKLSKINYVDVDESSISINSNIKEQLKNYRNIALFGLDSEGNSSRSDCIIIVSINKKTNDVKLVSVYRDSYLEIENKGLDKITHAYAYGGPTLAISSLNENLDLNITEFVTVNFNSTVEIIDAIDGITLSLTSEEVKYISGIDSAGTYTLNGSQALSYARIRKTDGGDYKRTERMRTVLTAVFDKAKKMSVSNLNTLADSILPLIYTNISNGEILSLIPSITSFKVSESEGWPYKVEGITLDLWYGVPVTLESNVSKLHNKLFNTNSYSPSDRVKEISNKIINKTGYTN